MVHVCCFKLFSFAVICVAIDNSYSSQIHLCLLAVLSQGWKSSLPHSCIQQSALHSFFLPSLCSSPASILLKTSPLALAQQKSPRRASVDQDRGKGKTTGTWVPDNPRECPSSDLWPEKETWPYFLLPHTDWLSFPIKKEVLSQTSLPSILLIPPKGALPQLSFSTLPEDHLSGLLV